MLMINRDLWPLHTSPTFFQRFLAPQFNSDLVFIFALHKVNNTLKSLNSSETNKRNEKKQRELL